MSENITVVIAESEQLILAEISQYLESWDYQVVGSASTGAAALRLVREKEPTLVLLDRQLKGKLDGIETARKVMQNFDRPVVMLSAATDPETFKQVEQLKAYGFLAKPFNEYELRSTINNALYHHGLKQTYKQKSERLDMIIKGADLGTWDWDIKTDQVKFNRRWSSMLGYKPTDIKPHLNSWEKLVHPADLPRAMQTLKDHLAGNTSFYKSEFRMQTADGGWKWIQDRGKVLARDAQGKPLRASGIHVDISDRKAAEKELRLQADILANIGQAVIVTDPQGRIIYWNKAAEKLYGWTAQEVHERPIYEITVPEMSQAQAQEIMSSLAAGQTWSGEFICQRKDKSRFPAHVTDVAFTNDQNELIGIIGISYDLSERKAHEQQLKVYQYALESALNGIAFADLKGWLTYVNPVFLRMWGYHKPEQVLGKSVLDFWHDKETARQVVAELKQKGSWQGELTARKADGSVIYVHLVTNLVTDDNGEPLLGMASFQDITEKKKTLRQLNKKRELLEVAQQVAHLGSWEMDISTGKCIWSDEFFRICGYDPQAFEPTAKKGFDIIHPDDRERARQAVNQAIENRGEYNIEKRIVRPDGEMRHVRSRGVIKCNQAGEAVKINGSFLDITPQKQRQEEREVTLKLLQIVNSSNNTHELIRLATGLIQEWSQCEAVGIRLRQGVDFPYFEIRGFPPEFVAAEKYLCARDQQGELVRDSQGNPVLECMCGNVICGRFDPELPFFTEKGSFWTNSTTELLASTSAADRQSRTRNRCNGEGYESVALIPLRTDEEAFGLLQLNDKNKNRFSEQRIRFYEGLADSLAIALSERQYRQRLRGSEKRYRLVTETAREFILIHDLNGQIQYLNPSLARLLGHAQDRLRGRNVHEFVAGDFQKVLERNERKRRQGDDQAYFYTIEIINQAQERIPVEVSSTIIKEGQQEKQILIVGRDIRERLHSQEIINEKIKTLNRFNRLMVGRENRMIQLKREVNELLNQAGRPARYEISDNMKNAPE